MSDDDQDGNLVARYANQFQIGFSEFEFLLEFGQAYGDELEIHSHTRVVITPAYVMLLVELLRESVENYRNEYGAITPAKRIRNE